MVNTVVDRAVRVQQKIRDFSFALGGREDYDCFSGSDIVWRVAT